MDVEQALDILNAYVWNTTKASRAYNVIFAYILEVQKPAPNPQRDEILLNKECRNYFYKNIAKHSPV